MAEVIRLKDQEARDVITTVLDRNVMVLAGAGAGKTHALIERMVAMVRTGVVGVDAMAAITFTRKAAGEMRGRFLLRLRSERDAVEGLEAERVDEALKRIDQCFIGTIHAFCGRLLRERPMDAGLSPDFSEIEERDEALLRRVAWDRFVQDRFAAADERLYEMEEYGIHPEDLYRFFGRRCGYRDLRLKETTTAKPDLRPAVTEVERFLQEVEARIPVRPEKRDKFMMAVRKARHFLQNHGIESDRDRTTLLKIFEGGLEITQKHWREEQRFAKKLKHEMLPQFQERVIAPALRTWREAAYRVVGSFVDDAVDYYDGVRRDQGKVTFQDLLIRTARMLRDVPGVRTYFQKRYRAILVDEFQDTDPVQAEIVMYLAGADPEVTDWRAIEPRPGSLFLVGDDKQSIYRFRRADVDTFRQVLERIEDSGGEVVRLNTSFRSLGSLCRWVSSAFPRIFDAPGPPYQATFTPLYVHRPEGVDPHCVRKISIPYIKRNPRDKIVAADADRIAGFIAAAIQGTTPLNHGDAAGVLDSKASAGDFMILTRTATRISLYARALEARGIPFDIVGGGRLGEAAELRALVSLLETVYLPDNPIPFLSYLRGPLVGLADDELYALRSAGGRFHYKAALPEDLNPTLHARLLAAVQTLERAEKALTTRPPASALECILEDTGLLAYASVHPNGQSSSRAGNLLRALSLVRQLEVRGMGWGEIVEDLADLVSDAVYNLEEMTLEAGRDDVVRLMNLHQAKGLQANVVFLADPYDLTAYGWEPQCHVSRSTRDPYLAMTVSKPKGEQGLDLVAQPSGWSDDRSEEERYQAAEESRLLYVAATRARNLLVVSRYEGRLDRGPWHPLYRHLSDVPELPAVQRVEKNGATPNELDWETASRAIAARKEAALRPTHSLRTVTGVQDEDKIDYERRNGRGRDYGVVVHHLFEDAVRGSLPRKEDDYVRRVVEEAGLGERLASDALRALERFRASRLWSEIQEAEVVYTEVPLGHVEETEMGPGVVRGVIDLVYRIDGMWKIVDYKTDAAATQKDVERLVGRYQDQLDAYVTYWEKVTGEPVVSGTLWFVHGPAREHQLALF